LQPKKRVWLICALALTPTWAFWIPSALLDQEKHLVPVFILSVTGGFGPLVAAVSTIYRTEDRDTQREFLRPIVSFMRIGVAWYLSILLFFPTVTALGLLIHRAATGSWPHYPFSNRSPPSRSDCSRSRPSASKF
jgi:hypothetical protein